MRSLDRSSLAVLVLALAAVLLAAPVSRAADETRIAELRAQFDEWERSSWPDFVITSLTARDRVRDLYMLEDALAAYANMHEATGELRYLERALELVRNEISIHPWTRANGSRWWHEDMKASLSSARLCRLGRAAGLAVDDIVRFLDEKILGYHLLERPFGDFPRGLDWVLAVHRAEPPTSSAGYWHGFQTLAARIAWDLTQLGVERWRDLATTLPAEFAKRVEYAPDGAALWDVGRMLFGESLAHTPDTGHYNRTVRWVVEVHRDGGLPRSLVDGLAVTFDKRIYQPRHGRPYLANYIDGRDLAYGESPPGGSGYLYDGWLMLGAYDEGVQRAGEAIYDMVREGGGQGPTYYVHERPTSRLAVVAGLAVNERRRVW